MTPAAAVAAPFDRVEAEPPAAAGAAPIPPECLTAQPPPDMRALVLALLRADDDCAAARRELEAAQRGSLLAFEVYRNACRRIARELPQRGAVSAVVDDLVLTIQRQEQMPDGLSITRAKLLDLSA